MTTRRPAARARSAASSSITPSWSQTPFAPAANRLVDVRARRLRAAEHVDDLDLRLVRDRRHARVDALAEGLLAARGVHRDHPEALALEERGDPVRVAPRVG